MIICDYGIIKGATSEKKAVLFISEDLLAEPKIKSHLIFFKMLASSNLNCLNDEAIVTNYRSLNHAS